MARKFTAASSQYFTGTSPFTADQAWSVAMWYEAYQNPPVNNSTLFSIGNSASGVTHYFVQHQTSGPIKLRSRISSLTSDVSCTNSIPLLRPIFVAATISTNQANLLIMANKEIVTGTTTNSGIMSAGTKTMRIGFPAYNSATAAYCDGRIGWVVVWGIQLNQADLGLMQYGLSPLLVHPESIVAVFPLNEIRGNARDWARQTQHPMTETNGPIPGGMALHGRIPLLGTAPFRTPPPGGRDHIRYAPAVISSGAYLSVSM